MNTPIIIALGTSITLTLLLLILVLRLNKRMSRFLQGKNAASLESVITELIAGQKVQDTNHDTLVKNTKSIHNRVTGSFRGFAIVRFNAYENTGGNQSFCCAFLDETGRGMLLSSLYSRERANVFAKPITKFTCEFELTKEEKDVLERAITSMQ